MKKKVPTSLPPKEFNDELYAARVAKRLARKAVAAKAEIDVSYLAALERGDRNPPGPEKLAKILDSLNVTNQERRKLEQSAFFTRLKIQILEEATPNLREATEVVTSIQQLTEAEIRVVKAVIDAMVANHTKVEAEM